MKLHRLLPIPVVLLLAPLVAVAVAPAEDAPPSRPPGLALRDDVLDEGEAIFWEGYIASVPENPAPGILSRCGDVPDACIDTTLAVGASSPGAHLRVAFDTEDMDDWVTMEMYDPSGELVTTDIITWSGESRVEDPAEGEWLVRLVVDRAEDAPYRMRAKLEPPASPEEGAPRPLLPNLRAEPPNDFTFTVPLPYSPTQLASPTPVTCLPDEIAEEGAQRCLRFSFGYGNWGDGPYRVEFSPLSDVGEEQRVRQVVYHSDGSTTRHDAGTYVYHKTHMHYHYEGIYAATLHRVLDADAGTTVEVAASPKRGACAHDWKIVDWTRFIQAPQNQDDSGDGCSVLPLLSPAQGAYIALSRGWADIYPWSTPMNYIEFAGQPDGCYLMLATADPDDLLLETVETDNAAYAMVQVSGDRVDMLERGYGASPWDPAREIIELHGACDP